MSTDVCVDERCVKNIIQDPIFFFWTYLCTIRVLYLYSVDCTRVRVVFFNCFWKKLIFFYFYCWYLIRNYCTYFIFLLFLIPFRYILSHESKCDSYRRRHLTDILFDIFIIVKLKCLKFVFVRFDSFNNSFACFRW